MLNDGPPPPQQGINSSFCCCTCWKISLFLTVVGTGYMSVHSIFGRDMLPKEHQTVLLKLLI